MVALILISPKHSLSITNSFTPNKTMLVHNIFNPSANGQSNESSNYLKPPDISRFNELSKQFPMIFVISHQHLLRLTKKVNLRTRFIEHKS